MRLKLTTFRSYSAYPNHLASILYIVFTDEVVDGTIQIPTTKPDPDKANPRVGVSLLSFSPDNRYMVSKNGECFKPMGSDRNQEQA